ncbi:hypothetical protein N8I87_42155 [Streptomyces sp. HUAS TT20]|nr:hypothetical protein [Streptomyces sp. HUAS 15-9]UXY32438.1 hypothetical protein N8I87_42155 [Streptomyces sp. HUAS 15-9]
MTSKYGSGENSANPSTKYSTSRAGNSLDRCSDRPHAAIARSSSSAGYTRANNPTLTTS